ncbi:Glycogen synthase [Candidatus Protochlamydia amoebophila]|uniref:glycogen synthase n=1 Tax=Candidatus Protochlamydia amoebophila TaxID=362787 RepID=UPI001BCA2B3E|nr:glycogen synthase [Candidatus Protochlamydia amoebophila]MBS4163497.1 Glycogen synthase [Candidatus Protochlamydia amoebophila]
MHIIHIASELAPLAKVGGLADVVLGLCRELSWKGHDVDIIIPKYDCMDSEQIRDLTVDYLELPSFYNGEWFFNTVWMGWVENLKVYFIEPHHPRFFFNRGCFYGCEDDLERFLYFSRTALEFLYKKSISPDIIHLHDWQTAVIAPLYKDMYQKLGYTKPKILFTIHNMEYQGKCAAHDLNYIGLDGNRYQQHSFMQDNLYPHLINLLKGGIVYSDFVTTVSPNYAKEVLTPKEGRGLEATLVEYQHKFKGILNGIDYSYWNPEIDRFLPAHYSLREMPKNKKDRNTVDKKGFIKKFLREKLYLAEEHRPIIGCITRLVPQKGIDLIKHTIRHIVEKKGQFILLGSSPIPSINDEFHRLKHQYTDHPHIHLILHHSEELAHLIYAGSDMFIVPSLFEPCGLTQIIALKYGTVPIVRRTGGLADTIIDVDHTNQQPDKKNGYVFDNPDANGIDSAIDRAIHCWFEEPEKWRQLMLNGMKMDFSWNQSSDCYLKIYQAISAKN